MTPKRLLPLFVCAVLCVAAAADVDEENRPKHHPAGGRFLLRSELPALVEDSYKAPSESAHEKKPFEEEKPPHLEKPCPPCKLQPSDKNPKGGPGGHKKPPLT